MKISSLHPIIVTDNAEKTMEFYASLGFTTKHSTTMAADSPVYIIANDDVELEIMQSPKNFSHPIPVGLYGLRFNVDDLDAAVEAIKQNGGTVVGGPFDTEWTSVYSVKDADGNNITIMKHIKK